MNGCAGQPRSQARHSVSCMASITIISSLDGCQNILLCVLTHYMPRAAMQGFLWTMIYHG